MYFQPDAVLIKLVHNVHINSISRLNVYTFNLKPPHTPFLFCLRDLATQQQSGNTLGNRVKIKQSPGSNPVCLSGAAAYIVFGTMYKYKKSTEIFHGFFSILLSSLNFSPLNDNEPQKLNRRIYCNSGNSFFLQGTSNYSESVIKCQKHKNNALLN